jgi:hypothetical protein
MRREKRVIRHSPPPPPPLTHVGVAKIRNRKWGGYAAQWLTGVGSGLAAVRSRSSSPPVIGADDSAIRSLDRQPTCVSMNGLLALRDSTSDGAANSIRCVCVRACILCELHFANVLSFSSPRTNFPTLHHVICRMSARQLKAAQTNEAAERQFSTTLASRARSDPGCKCVENGQS